MWPGFFLSYIVMILCYVGASLGILEGDALGLKGALPEYLNVLKMISTYLTKKN